MNEFRWTLQDGSGASLRASRAFASKEEAEAWMSTEWSELAAEGAVSVSLTHGDEVLYEMGLGEA